VCGLRTEDSNNLQKMMAWLMCAFVAMFIGALADDTVFYKTQAPNSEGIDNPLLLSSESGEFIMAAGSDPAGSIFTSTNFGRTWTHPSTNPPSGPFRLLAGDGSGRRSLIVDSAGKLSFSSDFGVSWATSNVNSSKWTDVAYSSSGNYTVAVTDGDGILMSSNGGVDWNVVSSSDSSWTSVAISSTGQFIIAANQDSDNETNYLFTSVDAGATWSIISTLPQNCYTHLTIDSTGTHMTATECEASRGAQNVWSSKDGGVSWATVPAEFWGDIAVSLSGQYVVAISTAYVENSLSGGEVWVSDNYGAGYSKVLSSPAYSSFYRVACSSSGQFMVVGYMNIMNVDNWFWTSQDFGQTWIQAVITEESWPAQQLHAITMNSAGDTLFAAVSGLGVLKSVDAGNNWDLVFANSSLFWWSIACNSAGDSVVAGTMMGTATDPMPAFTFVSQDAGASWTQSTASSENSWALMSSDDTGTNLIALNEVPAVSGQTIWSNNDNYTIMMSADGGMSWTPTLAYPMSPYPTDVVISRDGSSIYVMDYNGGFTSTDGGQSWSSLGLPASSVGTTYSHLALVNDSDVIFATSSTRIFAYNPEIGWQTALQGTVSRVVVAVQEPSTLIASTSDGLFVSVNYGAFWLPTSSAPEVANNSRAWYAVASDAYAANLVAAYSFNKSSSYGIYSTNYSVSVFTPTPSPTSVPDERATFDTEGVIFGVIAGVCGAGMVGFAGYYMMNTKATATMDDMSEPLVGPHEATNKL
jgi:hypothetical protein